MSRRCRSYPLCDPQGCLSDACWAAAPDDLDVDEAVLADQDERHAADDPGPEDGFYEAIVDEGLTG